MAQQGFNQGSKPYIKKTYTPAQGQYRKNDKIRVPQVRCIGPNGNQLGVISSKEALEIAKKYGLDLVEVSPTAKPPVCKILDFGKFMYEESKKQKGQKTTTTKVKEVKFRVNIEEHDYETKLKRAEHFLFKGHKVKFTMMFRGREMEQKDRGFDIIKRAIADLVGIATPDGDAKLLGRNIGISLTPLPVAKRQLKFNADVSDEDEPEDDED